MAAKFEAHNAPYTNAVTHLPLPPSLIQVYAYKLLPEGALSLQEPNKAIFLASHAHDWDSERNRDRQVPRYGVIEPGENSPVEASRVDQLEGAWESRNSHHRAADATAQTLQRRRSVREVSVSNRDPAILW